MRQWTDEDYRFGYQGLFAERDKETGLNHFRSRNYDGITGRWLAVDPQGQFSSAYVGMGNLPHLGVDPDGEALPVFVLPLLAGIGKAIGINLFTQMAMNAATGRKIGDINWGSVGRSALTAGITGGLDAAFEGGLNVAGAIPNGALQAGIGVGVNGLVNTAFGDRFFKGAGSVALTSGIQGAISGYDLAMQSERGALFGERLKGGRLRSRWDRLVARDFARGVYSDPRYWIADCRDCYTADFLLAKLYWHFQIGGNEDFHLDATTLDFSGTNQRELGIASLNVGERELVNLFDAGINSNSLGFGRIWVSKVNDSQFSVDRNSFDFSPLWDSSASLGRNLGNAVVNYNILLSYFSESPVPTLIPIFFGGGFDVIFNGNITIPRYR